MADDFEDHYAAATPFGRRVFDAANSGKVYGRDWLTAQMNQNPDLGVGTLQEDPAAAPVPPGPVVPKGPVGLPFDPNTAIDPPDELLESTTEFPPSDLEVATKDAVEGPGWFESFEQSFKLDNSGSRLMEAFDSPDYVFDPEWDATKWMQDAGIKERLAALPEPEEIGSLMGSSLNLDHANALLAHAEDEWSREQVANAHFTARIAANLVDPVDLAVTAAVAPAGALAKANKVQRVLRAGLAAAAGNAAIEAIAASQSPFRGTKDVAFAALTGLALGAPLGALGKGLDAKVGSLAEGAARDLDHAGAAKRVLDENESGNIVNPLAPRSAKRVAGVLKELPDEGEFAFGAAQKLQRNYIGRLFFSASDTVRRTAASMLEGGHLKSKGTRQFTAEGRANLIERNFRNTMMKSTYRDYTKWADLQGHGWFKRNIGSSSGEQFYSQVGLALKGLTDGVSKQASEAATKLRPLLDDMYEMATQAGVKGFDREKLPNFLPRMYSRSKWMQALETHGEDNLTAFFREALLHNGDDIEENLASKIAKGYVRSITRNQAGIDQHLAHGIPLDDMDMLREMLNPVDEPADKALVDEIVNILEIRKAKRSKDSGNVSHAKTRLRFNEGFGSQVKTRDGGRQHLSLTDLVENDARKVLFRYGKVMSGHIGLAKESNIKSRADFDAIKKTAIDEAMQAGRGDASDEVNALDDVYKLLTGTSVEKDPFSAASQLSRFASLANYVQYGGSFGVAQIPEMGQIVGHATVAGFLRHIPDYFKLLGRARNGELALPLAKTMDQMFSPGTDLIRNPAMASFDEFGQGFGDTAFGTLLRRLDPSLQSAARATAMFSLMAPINAVLQRSAGIQWAARVAGWAKGAKLTDANITRLRAAGVDADMQKRIFENIQKAAVMKNGRLHDLDVSKWTDEESLDAFRMSGNRESRRIIQENDIGNTGHYVHTPLGRTLTRFMSFTLNSVNKQLLRGVHHRDIETFVSWTSSMFFASLAYTGSTAVDYANDPKELKKRLAPDMIAKAAFARAGFASIMVPTIDTALWAGGFDPQFSHTRTSGLGTSLVTGNPTVVLAQDLVNTARLPLALLHDDYRFSRDDTDRFWRTMPFHRLLGLRNAYAAITSSLPARSTTDNE